MNIIEGEWDLNNIVMSVITIVFLIATIFLLAPFVVECLYRLQIWWDGYFWIPCLPCGVL